MSCGGGGGGGSGGGRSRECVCVGVGIRIRLKSRVRGEFKVRHNCGDVSVCRAGCVGVLCARVCLGQQMLLSAK